ANAGDLFKALEAALHGPAAPVAAPAPVVRRSASVPPVAGEKTVSRRTPALPERPSRSREVKPATSRATPAAAKVLGPVPSLADSPDDDDYVPAARTMMHVPFVPGEPAAADGPDAAEAPV